MAPQNSRTSVGLYRRAVRPRREICGSTLRRDGRSTHCLRTRLLNGYGRFGKLTKEVGGPGCRCCSPRQCPTRTVEAPAADADAGKRMWPGQGVDPYAEEARHTADWWPARAGNSRWCCISEPVRAADRGWGRA